MNTNPNTKHGHMLYLFILHCLACHTSMASLCQLSSRLISLFTILYNIIHFQWITLSLFSASIGTLRTTGCTVLYPTVPEPGTYVGTRPHYWLPKQFRLNLIARSSAPAAGAAAMTDHPSRVHHGCISSAINNTNRRCPAVRESEPHPGLAAVYPPP